jgi:hypothetical protein
MIFETFSPINLAEKIGGFVALNTASLCNIWVITFLFF